MSQDANSETEAYDKEYDAFLKQLDEFHQQRGTAFKRLPRINGKGVDLYLLYVVVTARGGWQKVNARNEWDEILEDFRLPASCVNSSVALKQIYMRYLDAYERVTFLGNDGDDKNNDNDDDDSSHPAVRGKKSVRALNVVPLTYNTAQHNVAESLRAGAKLCTSLFKPSQYDRLCMSLTSPLPNEHDFSFNLCTLLSNEGRQVMHLAQCPRLLEIMLGHVGVFRDDHCQKYFVSNIRAQKGKNLVQFWVDSIGEEQKHVLEVLIAPPARRSPPGRLELPTSAPGDDDNMDTSAMSVDSGASPGEEGAARGGSCSNGRDASNAVDEGGGGVKVNGDRHINSSDDDRGANRDGTTNGDSVREHLAPQLSSQTSSSSPPLPVNNKCSSSKVNDNNNGAVNASSDSEVNRNVIITASGVQSSCREENESEQSSEDGSRKRSDNCAVSCLLENNSKETSDLEKVDIYERLKKELGMSDCLTAREEVELFHCGRDSGLQDSEGTRIAQLIHILRNLSFEEDNVQTLAQSNTCLRFLVLCLCSRFGGLAVQALDTLGNISHEVILGEPCGLDPRTSSLLLSCVADGVFSEDRARVLRSLEVLNRLAMSDANEDVMAASIRQEVFDQICRYLTVHDIMLLIYTLESLYSLSSLGSASCNAIVRAPGSIHTLVALLTVEAQSYGPGACIGMKVVETVTGVVGDPDAASSTTSATTLTTGSTAAILPSTPAIQSSLPPPHSLATSHHTSTALPPPSSTLPPPPAPTVQHATPPPPPLLSSVVSTPTLAAANAAALQQQMHHNATNNNTINSHAGKMPLKNVMDMKKSVMSSTVPSDVEDFVCDWIRRSYEQCPGTMLEQAVVFRHFSSSMHALGKKQGFNPVLLSSCFRKVYGFKVGPTRHNPKDASDKWYYHDLRRRDTPLPMKVNDKLARGVNKVFNSPLCHTPVLARPAPDPSSNAMAGSSILKAQLSAPLRPISPAAAPPQRMMQQQPVSRNIQKQQQQAADSTSNNSSLVADTNGSINSRMVVNAAVNGVGFNGEPIKSEEDSSNSLASTMTLDVRKVTSFEGILQNGISSDQLPPTSAPAGINQQQMQQGANPSAVSTIVHNTFHDPNSIAHNPLQQQQQQQSVVVSNTYTSSSCVVSSSNSNTGGGGGQSPNNAVNSTAPTTTTTTIKKNVLADLLEKTLGGDILNGVVDKELRITDNNRMMANGPIIINNVSVNNSTSPYGVVGTTTTVAGGGGGLKRPGSEDYDESGAKRLAIDRGDGKITLYVSQNGGDGDGTVIEGSAAPPQQVVISGHNAMSLLAGGNIAAGAPKQQLVTSHGQIISSGTQLVTSSGQLVSGTQMVTSSGQLVTSGGQLVTSGGQLVTSSGQLITAGGQLVSSGGEQFVTSCGQLLSAGGQLVTTQSGQKVVVQGNFGQMLSSGQVVLSSQGGHIVVSGSGGGGEAVLVGGQLIQQGTQLIAAPAQQGASQQQTTHMVGQGSQLVTASGQGTQLVTASGQGPQLVTASGQIINSGQSQVVGTTGQVVVTQGQIISQGQGQVITQGSTGQIVGGQLVGQGQIMSQGQIVTQGQIISSQGQGQIISQGNVQGQIISQSGGQVVLQSSGQIGSQGHSQLMTQGQGQFITQGQGQIITQGQGHIISQGQILTQGQVVNSRGQLVAQGQIINSDQNQSSPSGQLVQGQIINQSQGQIVTQQGQLIPQGQGQLVQQGHVIAQGQQGQVVSQVQGQILSQGQVVGQNQRQVITQGPIVSQGQIISQGTGGQLVTQGTGGGTILTQSGGQILGHQTGSTFLVQQTPGAGKTLIILPAGQKVIPQPQHQSPLVVQQQQQQSSIPVGGQVVQVVNNSSGSIVRTIAAGSIITTTTTSSVPGGSITSGVHFTGAQQPQQHMAPNSQQQHYIAGAPTTTSHHIPTSSVIQQPPPPPPQPATPHVPAPQILASGIVRRHPPSSGNMVGVHSNPPKPGGLQYLCEWRGCNCVFSSPQQVYHHVCKVHCPPHMTEVQCLWAGCDPMVRKRFSAMTHLHDRHCNEQLLNILAVRRQQIATTGKTELPVPHAPPPHPGYAPNAAFHAIKRHALEVITQRDVVENEGPVTKSIRLTSALILRNLVIYSNSGRKLLRGYESELCNVAISTLESSRTVAQILHDIHLTDQ